MVFLENKSKMHQAEPRDLSTLSSRRGVELTPGTGIDSLYAWPPNVQHRIRNRPDFVISEEVLFSNQDTAKRPLYASTAPEHSGTKLEQRGIHAQEVTQVLHNLGG
jgi:hypothetical protein